MIKHALLCALFLPLALTAFGKTQNTPGKLHHIDAQIQTLHAHLVHEIRERAELRARLASAETQIGQLALARTKTDSALKTAQTQLDPLLKKQAQLDKQLSAQRHLLGEQLKTVYMMGPAQTLCMLLNEQDPAQFERTITDYGYFNRYRVQLIKSIQATEKKLRDTEHRLTQKQVALMSLTRKSREEVDRLKHENTRRTAALKALAKRIQTRQDKLKVLLQDKQALQHIVHKVHESPARLRSQDFAKLKGQLLWPTHGTLKYAFGSTMPEGRLKWQGVLINASLGQKVQAIEKGYVVFAKWLAGYGLLLIIDHGGGYMTLYARNQSLLVKTGDTVRAGQPIATVGHTGGFVKPALYFAIRHDGVPENPKDWCRAMT